MTGRRVGLPPVATTSAAEQLSRSWPPSVLQPMPAGQPGQASAASVGIKDSSPITFVVMGDSGGIAEPGRQKAVAAAIGSLSPAPAFVYHVGDVVYYNGDSNQIAPQFLEPYAHAQLPIVAIPGNHDSDPDPTISDPSQTGIATFLDLFCAKSPAWPTADPSGEYGRHTQTQPWMDWTLELEAVTIIGAWSNVPSGGHLYPEQIARLASELKVAPADRPVILAAHHPALSVDAHHGGSAAMGQHFSDVFAAADRKPELVLSGHVHTYQRFSGVGLTWLVSGNGGYANLHSFAPDARPGLALPGGVTFMAGDDQRWGFVLLTIDPAGIAGEYVAVDRAGSVSRGADRFQINR